MRQHSYVIGSGWWCDESDEQAWNTQGDAAIRSRNFHQLWYQGISRYTSPRKIVIIDSASPMPPLLNHNDPRLEFISLPVNSGHATTCPHTWCGWTKSFMAGLVYAALCEVEYYVYIEQDVLLKGEGLIEHAIDHMRGNYMFGSGDGTPQALQQSMCIVRTDAALDFIDRYRKLPFTDREMSPEHKFSILSTDWLPVILPLFLKLKPKRQRILLKRFAGFDVLPFGYGRNRPIDFNQPFFYFQHGSLNEIKAYTERFGFDFSINGPRGAE